MQRFQCMHIYIETIRATSNIFDLLFNVFPCINFARAIQPLNSLFFYTSTVAGLKFYYIYFLKKEKVDFQIENSTLQRCHV